MTGREPRQKHQKTFCSTQKNDKTYHSLKELKDESRFLYQKSPVLQTFTYIKTEDSISSSSINPVTPPSYFYSTNLNSSFPEEEYLASEAQIICVSSETYSSPIFQPEIKRRRSDHQIMERFPPTNNPQYPTGTQAGSTPQLGNTGQFLGLSHSGDLPYSLPGFGGGENFPSVQVISTRLIKKFHDSSITAYTGFKTVVSGNPTYRELDLVFPNHIELLKGGMAAFYNMARNQEPQTAPAIFSLFHLAASLTAMASEKSMPESLSEYFDMWYYYFNDMVRSWTTSLNSSALAQVDQMTKDMSNLSTSAGNFRPFHEPTGHWEQMGHHNLPSSSYPNISPYVQGHTLPPSQGAGSFQTTSSMPDYSHGNGFLFGRVQSGLNIIQQFSLTSGADEPNFYVAEKTNSQLSAVSSHVIRNSCPRTESIGPQTIAEDIFKLGWLNTDQEFKFIMRLIEIFVQDQGTPENFGMEKHREYVITALHPSNYPSDDSMDFTYLENVALVAYERFLLAPIPTPGPGQSSESQRMRRAAQTLSPHDYTGSPARTPSVGEDYDEDSEGALPTETSAFCDECKQRIRVNPNGKSISNWHRHMWTVHGIKTVENGRAIRLPSRIETGIAAQLGRRPSSHSVTDTRVKIPCGNTERGCGKVFTREDNMRTHMSRACKFKVEGDEDLVMTGGEGPSTGPV